MKKRHFWPVVAVVLVVFTVCLVITVVGSMKGETLGDEPPELTVIGGEGSVVGTLVDYTWDGSIACGAFPVSCADTAPSLRRGTKDLVELSFAVRPESVTVSGWRLKDGQGGGCAMADVSKQLENVTQLPLEEWIEGEYSAIYHVSARWDDDHSAGYLFIVSP